MRLVAVKDWKDALRDNQTYYLGIVFGLLGVGIGYLTGSVGGDLDLSGALVGTFLFFAPVTALIVSHESVSGKWASGELTVLLGLPISRSDVVYGSLVGRTAAVTATIVPSMLGAAVLSAVLGASPNPAKVLVGTAGVIVVVAVFASLSIAVSALSKSTTISSTGAFAVFLLFVFQLWSLAPEFVSFALDRVGIGRLPDSVIRAWTNLSPYAAIRNLAVGAVGDVGEPLGALAPGGLPANPPVVQHPAVAALILLAWATLPIVLATRQFETADL